MKKMNPAFLAFIAKKKGVKAPVKSSDKKKGKTFVKKGK